MLKIQPLKLPQSLPAKKALESHSHSEHNYEPEFWEFQYESYRYLKNIDNDCLIQRYKDIHRNFRILIKSESDVIPIDNFLSSWYWYRKEHQTRYEFFMRNTPLSLSIPYPKENSPALISLPENQNHNDIFFRYGESQFMKSFIKRGEIRISPASYYKDGAALNPRTDDELNKKRSLLGERSRIITKDGKEIPIIGDIHETVSMPANYYALCMSTNFEPYIFEEFKDYDSCVIIKDSEQFMVRLEMCSKNIIPNCDFHYNPVEYFDPCEPCKDQFFNPAMCKDFRFAYQTEYRAIWYPLEDSYIKNHIVLNLGSLEDICELYIK